LDTLREMDDETILSRIESLVAEEHSLQHREQDDAEQAQPEPLATDRERLEQVSVELDQCWDLLRQRRARRAAGEDPDEAEAREPGTVEKYLQ
jgi:acyl-CoA thioesterase